MTFLLIDKLCKRYGATEAVASSSLAIEKGEFVHSEVRETVDRERILRYLTI